jgi:GNAT superfamily N-acetyltransferase
MEAARPAIAADRERIGELRAELFAELGAYRGGDLWVRERTSAARADESAAYVGTIDDAVVAYGIVEVVELRDGARIGAVTELYVEPDAREVGVGETLVNALLDWCRERECIGVDATALPGHRAAKNFFEEQGFVSRSLTMYRPLPPGDGTSDASEPPDEMEVSEAGGGA